MGKKYKKIKSKNKKSRIPKNRDIKEIVENIENTENVENINNVDDIQYEEIETMDQVIRMMDEKREEFKRNIQVTNQEIEKRTQNFSNRLDAQCAEDKRRIDYLKAMSKLEENKEDNKEVQEFFDDIQRRTNEYLEKQDEEKQIAQNEKYGEKYDIQPKTEKKNKKEELNKNKTPKKASGTSMKEILKSEEFKQMWEEER